jgi:hypothetical protein
MNVATASPSAEEQGLDNPKIFVLPDRSAYAQLVVAEVSSAVKRCHLSGIDAGQTGVSGGGMNLKSFEG